MYRNFESLCCAPKLTSVVGKQNRTPKQTNSLKEKEIRFVVTRGRVGVGVGKLDEGGQKVRTSNYKIHKY